MCGCGGSRKNITTQTVEQTQQQTAPQPPTTDSESGQRVGERQKIPARS